MDYDTSGILWTPSAKTGARDLKFGCVCRDSACQHADCASRAPPHAATDRPTSQPAWNAHNPVAGTAANRPPCRHARRPLRDYCPDRYNVKRRKTRTVECGPIKFGSEHKLVRQTMATTDTRNVEATIEQVRATIESRRSYAPIEAPMPLQPGTAGIVVTLTPCLPTFSISKPVHDKEAPTSRHDLCCTMAGDPVRAGFDLVRITELLVGGP